MTTYDIGDDLPEFERTMPAVLKRRAVASGSGDFLWFSGQGWIPFEAFAEGVERRRHGLRKRGVRKGDRVCVLMRNSPAIIEVMFALWSEGAVVVPLSAGLIGPLLRDQVQRAEPVMLVCDVDLGLAEGFGALRVDASDIVGVDRVNDAVDVGFTEPALILYTSGSTGPSKGCVLSHHFCVYYGWVFWRYMGYRGDDTIYSCLPLNHVHALFASFLPALLGGGRFAFAEKFSASGYWTDLVESGATTCSAIGPMAGILLRQPQAPEEARLKVRLAHIAPAPPQVDEFQRRFRLKVASTLFGMSEAMLFPPDPDRPPVNGVIGTQPADWDIAIIDDAGRPVGDGEPGELVARPRRPGILFDGYFGMPQATADAWRGLWYHTGDICRRDADGVYWFMGRRRDIIRRRGHNISAWEVETTLAQHPAVAEASAVPVPSGEEGEEALLLVARCSDGNAIEPAELVRFSDEHLPRFMQPDHVEIWSGELPKTQSGKIDKPEIRRLFAERGERSAA